MFVQISSHVNLQNNDAITAHNIRAKKHCQVRSRHTLAESQELSTAQSNLQCFMIFSSTSPHGFYVREASAATKNDNQIESNFKAVFPDNPLLDFLNDGQS